MVKYVIAGDIGGTKTDLAIYSMRGRERPALVREDSFASKDFAGLEPVVSEFLAAGGEHLVGGAFGIAGPVLDDAVTTTNLPWRVEARSLARLLGCERVRLMNDLETTALGALFLPPEDFIVLNSGVERTGNRAIIAAGTGLGQAFLFWDRTRHQPSATEGGHVDFAPRDDKEAALLGFLRRQYPRVSYERVVSGPGLVNIFRFLTEELGRAAQRKVREGMREGDPSAVIGEAGVAGTCPTCTEAVEMFAGLYGAQAGNLALTVMALGGVYVAGGIVTKLLPKMMTGTFMSAFTAKGRYAQLMKDIPVRIVLNPKTSQLGAAEAARALAE